MKRNWAVSLFIVIGIMMFQGCTNGKSLVIRDNQTHKTVAYFAGKGMGFGVNHYLPQIDADLTREWEYVMQKNSHNDFVPPEDMLGLFNSFISIASVYSEDPFGLVGDLGVMTMIYGAEFDDSGKMTRVDPVPMVTMRLFGMGYANGKRQALR